MGRGTVEVVATKYHLVISGGNLRLLVERPDPGASLPRLDVQEIRPLHSTTPPPKRMDL